MQQQHRSFWLIIGLCVVCAPLLLVVVVGIIGLVGSWIAPIVVPHPEETIGEYVSKEYYSTDGWRDYDAYGQYRYDAVHLEDNEYFIPLPDMDIEQLQGFVEHFEDWVAAYRRDESYQEFTDNYAFSMDLVSDADYCYLEFNESNPYHDYTIYFLDAETLTVHYLRGFGA